MSQGSVSITTVHLKRLPWVFVFLMSIAVSFFVPASVVLGQEEDCGKISVDAMEDVKISCENRFTGTSPGDEQLRTTCRETGRREIQIAFQACTAKGPPQQFGKESEYDCNTAFQLLQNEARGACEETSRNSTLSEIQTEEEKKVSIQQCVNNRLAVQETVSQCEKRLSDQNVAGYWTCFVTFERSLVNNDGIKTTCSDFRKNRTGKGVSSLGSALNAQAACYSICDQAETRRVPGQNQPTRCEFIRTLGCKDENTLDITGVENARLKEQEFKIRELQALTAKLPRLRGNSIPQVIGSLISVALQILGSIAFVLFVYGGVLWMISSGGDKQAKAMKIITWTALGLIVILASYALTDFLVQSFIP